MLIELIDKQTHRIVAGEISYAINSTYTSLTGFFTREKRYNNWDKLQLVLLAHSVSKKQRLRLLEPWSSLYVV